ncbi:efflux RND transporter permease subunit [Paucibacter sp. TC2R-5]|uniref:efflux RND transporter permease subunit n=1 Tax=Paucibacter sp. TC2R-5 TaxID=2893555 RepID=UPI0021E3CE7B|nr:efflux RND transporter permease subunit [Paucibacter sp. TC2R-5]MCV2361263.1 efflux RND transporter permease subunit [Paucibacter sp. TC2R-5]
MNFSAPFIKRPVATTLLTLGLLLLGGLAYLLLPVASLPEVDSPTISVSANLPGASAETMAATVATPLERALGSIAGITEMTSTSSQGSARVTLQFDLSRNIDAAARQVQAAINAARAILPSGLPGNPGYRKVNPSDPPIMILALRSDTVPVKQLFDVASTVLAQRIAQVRGVGDVGLAGGSLPAVRIAVDPNKLSAQGLSLEQLRQAVVASNANRPKGYIEELDANEEEGGGRQWQIAANDQAARAADYAPLVLKVRDGAVVRLQDVAEVSDATQDVRAYGLADGARAIILRIQRAPNANVLETVDGLHALLPQMRAGLPEGARLEVMMDRTLTIRASLKEVQITLLISIGLVIVVVYAFLRSLRATLIPAVVVPASLAGTLAVMYLLGYTLDNLSLMALTVATGFVVDDAIVVMENISRHLERGKTPLQAALDGALEIWFTVVAISLSLIAAFIPILYMGGYIGRLFREFAVVLSVAILVSMLVSLTATPMMAARLMRAESASPKAPGFWQRLLRRLQRGYRRSLRWTLRHQPVALLALAGVIGLNVYLYQIIPKGFFPQQDVGRMIGGINADQGSSFQAMQGKMDAFMEILRADPAIAHVTISTGGGQSNGAQVFVALKPLAERKASVDEVLDRLRPKLAKVPGAALFLRAGAEIRIGGRQSDSEYQFTLQADELKELATWEPRIRRGMSELKELTDVSGDRQDRGLQTSLVIDRDALALHGISMRDLSTALNNAFGQRQVSVIYNPQNQYRVVMELAPEYLQSAEALQNLFLTARGGAQVPLAALARIEPTLAPLSVAHDKGTPATTLSFNLATGVSLSQATAAIDNLVAELGVPVAVRGVYSGTVNAFQATLANQPWLVLAAMITIYILLGVLYESLLHPITILSTLPSAGVGALLALMGLGFEFSIIAMIGVVLLIGIVKKNAIMMIDFAIARQKLAAQQGRELPASAAIYRAAHMRLRPILMTTFAALFGALPLAIGMGVGSELRQPLGIAVVGGLLLSQLLTLYTTPVVFLCMDRLRLRLARLLRRAPGHPRALPVSI